MSSLLVEDDSVPQQEEPSKKPNLVQQILPKSRQYSTLTGEYEPEESIQEPDRGQRRLKIAAVLCFFFVIGEFIAGVIAKSTAVQADAAHLLTDLFSFLISLLALHLSARPETKRYTYGWARAEVIGALFSIIILWMISAVLCYIAIDKIQNPELDLDEMIMIYIASAAIVFNIVLAFVLHGSGHSHSHGAHGHSHGDSHGANSVNVRAAMVHVVGDLVQSIGVLIAGLVVRFYPGTKSTAVLADPICTLIFILIVMVTTVRIVIDLVGILMGAIDPKITENVEAVLLLYAASIHSLHIWCVVPDKYVLTCRIQLKESYDVPGHPIVRLIEEKLNEIQPGLISITVQTHCLEPTAGTPMFDEIENFNSLPPTGVDNPVFA